MSGVTIKEEDKKPNVQSTHITLKIQNQDENEVFFRIKRSTQLRTLMNGYCDRHALERDSLVFLFDGHRIRGDKAPDELEMVDGDEIDAMGHQLAGATVYS